MPGHDKRRVVCEKAFNGKVARLESRIAVYEHDYDLENERYPGYIWLEVATVWQRLAIRPLSLTGLIECDVRATHDDEVDYSTGGNDIR